MHRKPPVKEVQHSQVHATEAAGVSRAGWRSRSLGSAGRPLWLELALVSPLFGVYHVGVAFLPVQNAADWVTRRLIRLADHQLPLYVLFTLALSAGYLGLLYVGGRWKTPVRPRFLRLGLESIGYALSMRALAGLVVGRLGLGGALGVAFKGPLVGVVMSAGAGLYEELLFRVLLFDLGGRALVYAFGSFAKPGPRSSLAFRWWVTWLAWGLVSALLFSAWHHVGDLAEPFTMQAFVFRFVCGSFFCGLYAFRGLAVAAWTHALYDVGVLAL